MSGLASILRIRREKSADDRALLRAIETAGAKTTREELIAVAQRNGL